MGNSVLLVVGGPMGGGRGHAYAAQHAAILHLEPRRIVLDKLAAIRRERALMVGAEVSSLLAGLIVDAGGNAMAPKLCYKGQAILLLRLGVASGW
jgi:hypothetical protein